MRARFVLLAFAALNVAGVLVALGLVANRDARVARTGADAARKAVQKVAGDPGALREHAGRIDAISQLDAAAASLNHARARLRRSLPVKVATIVPLVHHQRRELFRLIDDARVGLGAGRAFLRTLDGVADQAQFRDGIAPVPALGRLRTDLHRQGRALARLTRGSSGLWSSLRTARREFDRLAAQTSRRLLDAADIAGAAQTFLGDADDRRVLVAVENNAEMRDRGMTLAYGIALMQRGRLSFEQSGPIRDLFLSTPPPTPIPPGTAEVFGVTNPTLLWQSVAATADFAWSGRAMADMATRATGRRIDAVVAIDVPALARLLGSAGPVAVEGLATPLTSSNVEQLFLHDQYEGLAPGGTAAREALQAAATRAMFERLTHASLDVFSLSRELGTAVAGGHLRLWSSSATEERVFERVGAGGGPALTEPERTFHLAVENRTATKLDFYVFPSVHHHVIVRPDGSAVVDTEVTIDNRAPENAAPSYALGPDKNTTKAGEYVAWVLLWTPLHSSPLTMPVESGLNLRQEVIRVGAGDHRVAKFRTLIPRAVRGGRLALRFTPQPRSVPVPVDVEITAPGWHLAGSPTWRGQLDRTLTLHWQLSR